MSENPTPLHLAIIPDGNRRWANERNLHPWKGHEKAIDNFKSITEWCYENPMITALTVWCFSTENWKRDPKEIAELMGMLERYLGKERKGFLKKHTRFVHSGRKDRIPSSLATLIEEVETETAGEKQFTLNLAVDYGGKDELLRAVEKLAISNSLLATGSAHNSDPIRPFLDHPELPDIDLVIRTSGEFRTSNFCLWESVYAEWIFHTKYFPDFAIGDLEDAMKEYERRKRRFGG